MSPKAGSSGSPWWTIGWQYGINPYSGKKTGLEFSSVPFFEYDFHCDGACNTPTNPFILNYGGLSGLCDLNTEKVYVQQRIDDYLTELLSIVVSDVRIDAPKHTYHSSLASIFKKTKN